MTPTHCPRCHSCAAIAFPPVIACSACGWRSGYRNPAITKGASHPGHTNPSKPSRPSHRSKPAHR
jgi:hypothetical protein